MPTVTAIIPTMKGREDLLYKLLVSLPDAVETITVDDEDLLLAAKRNKGAMKARGEYFLFIDDDNYVEEEAIQNLLNVASCQQVGIAGMMACYDNKKGKVADGGSERNLLTGFTRGINTNQDWEEISKEPYAVDEVANAFMIHSELFFELQGFDERNFPIDLDEADLCKRAKSLGYEILMCPAARCYHKSQTYSHIPDFRRPLNAYFMGRNRQLYQRKHSTIFNYALYLVLFMPVFVLFYCCSLLYRKKITLIGWFLKGVFDGIFARRKNKFQQG